MIALIDADIVAFRCSAASENDSEAVAHLRCDDMMRKIIHNTNADKYLGFISGQDNFRFTVYPDYKANRKNLTDPKWRQSCIQFLVQEWGASVTSGYEADDALGINQDKETETTMICSIDKDLKQIPGLHYNFVKEEFDTVTKWQGLQHFYRQLLIGDTVDNIFGIHGIGPKKAAKIINPCETEQEMFDRCRALYKDDQRMIMNGKCLWILQQEEAIWNPENLLSDGKSTEEV